MTFDVDFGEITIVDSENNEGSQNSGNSPQNTMYKFSFADLGERNGILSKIISKKTIASKGDVSVNIPVISFTVLLFTGVANLTTNEVTPLLDLPISYNLNAKNNGFGDLGLIENFAEFTPYLIIPTITENIVDLDLLFFCIGEYITNGKWNMIPTSFRKDDNNRYVGIAFVMDMEFANEAIRDAFYSDFAVALEQASHFCLKHEGCKTVESSYIGGDLYEITEEYANITEHAKTD